MLCNPVLNPLQCLSMSDITDILEGEAGNVHWLELQPHFARGVVFSLNPEKNLIDVAGAFVQDDKAAVADLLETGSLRKVDDEKARLWLQSNPLFAAIVVAPWVLIQEAKH